MKLPKNNGDIITGTMYRVEKIRDYVYHIEDCIDNPSSMYCIVGNKKVLWVDTANTHSGSENELREIVDQIAQDKEVIVAITHNHFDHVGQLSVFDKEMILFPIMDKEDKDYSPQFKFIEDGCCIDLGGLLIKAVSVPGHTAGSMVFIEDQEELVITGDAIGSSFVWLFFMDNVLAHYKKGIHHLYDQIKAYQSPLFLCGHRWQQAPSPTRDPLSPINMPMGMQYLLDMIRLVEMIEKKTANTRTFNGLNHPELHCVYSFEGSKAEIDSFISLMQSTEG